MTPEKSNAPTLKEAQRALQRAIIEEDSADQSNAFEHPERLSVYAEGYVARIHEALQESFELVYRVVGEERSYGLIYDYVHGVPPTSYNITDAGSAFARFLETHPAGNTFPFLPDLARLEWAIVRAFHAKQENLFEPTTLGEVPMEKWESARFSFQPFVSVVSSKWPVYDLWKARKAPDKEFPVLAGDDRRPCHVLIYRSGFEVRTLEIDGGETSVLGFLMEGNTLGEACEKLSEKDVPTDITTWFARWVQLGLISSCNFTKTARSAS